MVSDLREAIFLLLLQLAGKVVQEAREGGQYTASSSSFLPVFILFFIAAALALAVAAVVIWVIREER